MNSQTPPDALIDQIPRISSGSKEYYLLGTAHISARSCEEVENAIRSLSPDEVLIELDPQRLESLLNPDRWASLDVREVIRKGQLPTLIANLMLSSYQRRMGESTGVKPGAELLRAYEVCQELNIPFVLGDRPIKSTLKRLWASVGLLQKGSLLMTLLGSMFESKKMDEDELSKMREADALHGMLSEMDRDLPQIRRILIDERDSTMTEHMQASSAEKILAIVGAGHVPGMKQKLENSSRADLKALEEIPKPSIISRLFFSLLSLLLVAVFVLFVMTRDNAEAVYQALEMWVICTSLPALGAALIARAHWVVCLVVTALAPFAAFLKAIPGPKLSLLAAGLQAWLKPPLVSDMQNVSEELGQFRKWWSNRLLRIFLVFTLPGLATTLGALYALKHFIQGS